MTVKIQTLTDAIKISVTWNAQNAFPVGTNYSPLTSNSNFSVSFPNKSSVANNVAGGGDEALSVIFNLAANAVVDLDLTNFQDVLGQLAASFARIKGVVARNLSTTDDPTYGANSIKVQIGGYGGSSSSSGYTGGVENPMMFGDPSFYIYLDNGAGFAWGTPQPLGITVDSTHKMIRLANLDPVNAAAIQMTFIGGSS